MPSDSLDVLARLSLAVPAALAARAARWSATDEAVTPVPSASVILLREQGGVLQTYLLHRHARMPFAASMVVFPGGRVDPVDAAGGDPVRTCARRETLEETGVTLADSGLHPWAHWTTPELEPRRYDTEFFVAVLPEEQHARDISGETDRAGWSTAAEALQQAERGEIALMPPTLSMLLELADASSVAAVLDLARDRRVRRVLPRVEPTGGGWVFRYPEPPS